MITAKLVYAAQEISREWQLSELAVVRVATVRTPGASLWCLVKAVLRYC